MIHASIQWGGDTWEVAIALDNSATITSSRFQRQGTFCGELLHDFTGRNFVPEQVLGLPGQALGEQASAVSLRAWVAAQVHPLWRGAGHGRGSPDGRLPGLLDLGRRGGER